MNIVKTSLFWVPFFGVVFRNNVLIEKKYSSDFTYF